jgi:hypothetical protein
LGSGGSSPSLAGRADGTLVAAWTGLGTTGGDDNGSPGIRAAIFDLSLAPTAHRDGSLTKAGEALSLSTAGLLANDSDLDGDSLTITGISNASHGTVSRDGTTIHFTPAAGFTGEAGFDYTVSDGKGGTDTAHASVFVLPETLPSDWRLLAADGFKGEIGGNGAVTGNSGYQEIGVLDLAGAILFDPSFNRGGDVIRLGGESATWNVVQSGSSAMLLRGETVVIIPLGITPSKLVFDDGWLNLRYDTAAGSPKIGTQAFSTSVAPITATANTLELPDNSDADAVSKLFLASHRDVALDGRYAIIGTAGAERIDFIGGRLQLDPSFNRGGDTLAVDDPAFEFSAIRIGSSVKLAHLDGSEVLIPFGTAGMTIGFNGDERELYFDTTLGAILLGSQVIGASAVTLIA